MIMYLILIFLRWYVSRSEDAFKSFVIIAHWLAALVVVSYVCGLVTKFTNQHSAEKDSTLTRNSLSMHLSKKIVFWRGWYCKTGLEVMTKMRKLVTEIWIYNRNVFHQRFQDPETKMCFDRYMDGQKLWAEALDRNVNLYFPLMHLPYMESCSRSWKWKTSEFSKISLNSAL